MSPSDLPIRTLREAVLVVGDPATLAHKLGVEPDALSAWLKAEAMPPRAVFLKALDFLGDVIRNSER